MNTGGSAFPLSVNPINALDYSGMTLRDYFAAKAMQGIFACSETLGSVDDFARWSYQAADAMLKAREE